ncbi:MAG: DUF1552 domain-containing protein [Planctomycetales bacterium]|nr:DUF1552 domain-containing protein [Planctomycetales bacterium]
MARRYLSRRSFLRGTAGIALSLPALEAMGESAKPPMRLICIGLHLGLHGPAFFPKQAGSQYELTPLLRPLESHRRHFTVFSNLEHAGVGKGHPATVNFLTGTDKPKSRKQASLDQVAAATVGKQTRFASLQLEAQANQQKGRHLSWAPGGIALPQESDPRAVFDRLFKPVSGAARQSLANAKSVLDHVLEDARGLQSQLGAADRAKLDEYLAAIRDVEADLQKAERLDSGLGGKVGAAPEIAIPDGRRLGVREGSRVMMQLAALAFQADLTRVVTLRLPGEEHALSHHGQKRNKVRQLVELQSGYMTEVAEFLKRLQSMQEPAGSLLDHTIVLLGSGMGNASTHSTKDLPILVAGGGFRHGRHVRFGNQAPPLANLYVTLLRQMGLPVERFANSHGAMNV